MNARRLIFAIVGIALLVALITPATVLADIEETRNYQLKMEFKRRAE